MCHPRHSAACNIKYTEMEQGASRSWSANSGFTKLPSPAGAEKLPSGPLMSATRSITVPLDTIKRGMNCHLLAHEHTISSTVLGTLRWGPFQPVSSNRCSAVPAQVGHCPPPSIALVVERKEQGVDIYKVQSTDTRMILGI